MFADKKVNLGIGKSRGTMLWKAKNSLFSCHYPDGEHVFRLGKNKALLN